MTNLSTQEKALALNLQPSIYGVFAEIGAGQEVVNHFYQAGAASGTIAKSISAYDMCISDSMYGNTRRYVSKERLESMIQTEYDQLIVALSNQSATKHFFAFANTIQTTNFNGTNKGQGWMGVKFQLTPNNQASTYKIHVIMHTDDVIEQRHLIGVLGVNLIHAAYEFDNDHAKFIEALKENINPEHLEINFIETEGPNFDKSADKTLSLLLVKKGLTKMILFNESGQILQPINAFYKKDVIMVRGRFKPPTNVTSEMFLKSQMQLLEHGLCKKQNIYKVAEITFNCYQDNAELEVEDFMARTELINQMGYPVMVTNFTYHSDFLRFMNAYFSTSSINIVLGSDNIKKVFGVVQHDQQEDKIIDLLAQLTKKDNRILVFPELDKHRQLNHPTIQSLPEKNQLYYKLMLEKALIVPVLNVDSQVLQIRSGNILQMLSSGIQDWQQMVPSSIIPSLQSGRLRML